MQYCPNCGKKESELTKISDTQWYCPDCDETYTIEKGKPRVDKSSKTKFDQIADTFKNINDRLKNIENNQSVEDDEEFFGF